MGHGFQKLFLSQHHKAMAFHHPGCFLLQHSLLPLLQFQNLHRSQPSCSPFPLATGFAALCQAVNITRHRAEVITEHLAKGALNFSLKNLFPENLKKKH